MKKALGEKKIFYSEYAYFFSVLFMAMSIAFMKASGLGVSLASAPALVLYEKVAELQPISYGMAEYTMQALILVILILATQKYNKTYAFSFVSTLIFAFVIDALSNLLELLPLDLLWVRALLLIPAIILGPLGSALMSHSYISPIVYEFFEKELSKRFDFQPVIAHWVYSVISGVCAMILSAYFFDSWPFVGVNIGTVLYTLSNILLYRPADYFITNHFKFRDKYKELKRHF